MEHNAPCKDLIEIKVQIKSLIQDLLNVKADIKSQDMAIRHNDKLMGEMYGDIKNISTQLTEIKDNMKNDKNKTSERNWTLWMLLIATIMSSMAGLILNLVK